MRRHHDVDLPLLLGMFPLLLYGWGPKDKKVKILNWDSEDPELAINIVPFEVV